jgi:hypothetical protein
LSFDGVHLGANQRFNLGKYAIAERQDTVNSSGNLADISTSEQELVADQRGIFGCLLEALTDELA